MNDKVVLVTGGAGNLGRSVTRMLLESGGHIAVPFYKTDTPESIEALQAEFGDRVHVFAFDLTTERGAAEAVREAVGWKGKLDAVVHLVGGYRGGFRLAETPIEVWDRMMDLNLKSAWLVGRAAIPHMQLAGGGTLVFISARAARGVRRGHAPYAISKSALITLAESIAEEYGEEGIRANVVLPGTLDTDDNRRMMPEADRASWTLPDDVAREILRIIDSGAEAGNGKAIEL
jgi:NAD(P)-dependent dehydrogenase (short-subunit alcohol dehydrogenase family)